MGGTVIETESESDKIKIQLIVKLGQQAGLYDDAILKRMQQKIIGLPLKRAEAYLEKYRKKPVQNQDILPFCKMKGDSKLSGRSRYAKMFVDDINEFYKNMSVCNIASMHQIQRVLLESGGDFSVIRQISFFLGMKPEELTAPSLTIGQMKQEHDSHYMKNAVPIDWELLNMEAAPVLEKFAKDVYDGIASESGRPERVSEKLVYREMNLLGHQLENMSRCKAIFKRYTESYPESWVRKIIWAYKKLKESGEVFYWSDIRKNSGIKKKNLQFVISYLQKYADADTVSKIMVLVSD